MEGGREGGMYEGIPIQKTCLLVDCYMSFIYTSIINWFVFDVNNTIFKN
jgi:hypothetical protein